MHWHSLQVGYMTYGTGRITTLDELGRPLNRRREGRRPLVFPSACPHSLQGLGPDGFSSLSVSDEVKASEFTTLLGSEWFTHTRRISSADNFGVPAETFPG